MKTIIAGSRDITNYAIVEEAVRASGISVSTVVSGKQRGVDTLGERWAKAHGVEVAPYPAEWKAHGRAAGPIRNRQMADNADALIAVWDGFSPGTKDMIDVAKRRGLTVYVHDARALSTHAGEEGKR